MRRLTVFDGVTLLGFAAALLATWSVYDRLPDPIPTHFALDGTPNDWTAKVYGAWLLPLLFVGIWALVRFLPLVLPRSEKLRLAASSVPLVAMMTGLFMSAVHVVILYVALSPGADVARLTFVLMGALSVALGLVMPRVRRNPLIGIRTPWTLTSDENWARTHRVAGYSMVLGGLACSLVALAGGPVAAALGVTCFLAGVLVPTVWSLVHARRHDPG